MSSVPPATFRLWFDYERDAHAKTLASLLAVPEEKRPAPEFRRAVDLLAHVLGARWFWLAQIGATSEKPVRFFSKEFPVADLPRRLSETEAAWSRYLEGLTGDELARSVDWGPADGPRFTNSVEDVLTQLFGHSTYHRGQIALLLRQIGCQPPATEFIYFSRRPAGSPAG
jgi:uncharacterized damage-inducible protein DinB